MNDEFASAKFPRGKYKGHLIRDILQYDPSYIEWMYNWGIRNPGIRDQKLHQDLHKLLYPETMCTPEPELKSKKKKGGAKMTGKLAQVFIVTKGKPAKDGEKARLSTIIYQTGWIVVDNQQEFMLQLGAEQKAKIEDAGGFSNVEFLFHYPSL